MPLWKCSFRRGTHLSAIQMLNESRDDVAKHIGRDIEQELHHKAPSFTENCPANFLDHIKSAGNLP